MASPIKFLQETLDEMKKVVWPKRTEVVRLTIVVIMISLIVGMYVGGLDFMFTKIIQAFVTTGPAATQTTAKNTKRTVSPVPIKAVAKPTPGKLQ